MQSTYLAGSKNSGSAQNILGLVKGQGISNQNYEKANTLTLLK